MSPEERTDLSLFLEQLIRARGVRKDPEADQLIQHALDQQPDASYLLVQRALLLESALDQAKQRIAALEAKLQATPAGEGRIGNEVGALAAGWGRSNSAAPPSSAAPASGYAQPAPAGGSSWLGQMASTAAGVAAGAFLFQGIENLLSHHSGYAANPGEHLVEADPFPQLSADDPELRNLSQTTDDFDESDSPDDDLDASFEDNSDLN